MELSAANQMLPTSIMELNIQVVADSPESSSLKTCVGNEFDDIPVGTLKLKREVSLPVGLEDWNIDNYATYLDFEENAALNQLRTVIDDGIVPEGDQRVRCPSISSVSSFHDDIYPSRSCAIKTFSTVCIDSGSTCISSDFSYLSSKQKPDNWLDPEETYQNLDLFVQEVPQLNVNTDTLSSHSSLFSSSSCDATMELPTLRSLDRPSSSSSFDGFAEKLGTGMKRRLDSNSEDEVFIAKQPKEYKIVKECQYVEIRRKNNIASKHCRKTRKEKQREMEQRVSELEQEKETLRVKVEVLEELIQAHKTCLLNAIVQRR